MILVSSTALHAMSPNSSSKEIVPVTFSPTTDVVQEQKNDDLLFYIGCVALIGLVWYLTRDNSNPGESSFRIQSKKESPNGMPQRRSLSSVYAASNGTEEERNDSGDEDEY